MGEGAIPTDVNLCQCLSFRSSSRVMSVCGIIKICDSEHVSWTQSHCPFNSVKLKSNDDKDSFFVQLLWGFRTRGPAPGHLHSNIQLLGGGGYVYVWLKNSLEWAKENKIPSTPTPSASRLHWFCESVQPLYPLGGPCFSRWHSSCLIDNNIQLLPKSSANVLSSECWHVLVLPSLQKESSELGLWPCPPEGFHVAWTLV